MMAVISPWAMCRLMSSSARTSLSPRVYTFETFSMSIIDGLLSGRAATPGRPDLDLRRLAAPEGAFRRAGWRGGDNFHIVARSQAALDDDQVVDALPAGDVDALQRAGGIHAV